MKTVGIDNGARASKTGSRQPTIKVVFCWTEASGYMAACWRALARRPGIDLHVVHLKQLLADVPNPFLLDPALFQGISNEMCAIDTPDIDRWLIKAVADRQPDVVAFCGWLHPPYVRLAMSNELKRARVIVGMDSPWRGTLSQRVAKFRLATLLKRVDLFVTSGERSAEYARRLGVPENHIRMGYYGFDQHRFRAGSCERGRKSAKWPRQFLYVGRYVPQKNLAALMKAYSAYRSSVDNPWGLTCSGIGVDANLLQGVPGVVDAGFTKPEDLPELFGRHGAFVLSSRFEPWGVVLAEAAASGLPIICTSVCGAGVDIVRPYYNGLVVASQDVDGLARAMRWMHDHECELPVMGRRGQALAEPYSAEVWATRWHNYFLELLTPTA